MVFSNADRFKTKKIIPSYNDNGEETRLEFKEHREFFRTLFELRTRYSIALGEVLVNSNKESKTNLLRAILDLIDWTNSQLSKRIDIKKTKESIIKSISTLEKDKLYFAIDEVYQQISKVHEETELIPKVQVVSQEESDKIKFWKDEDNNAVKELKKAWADMFLIE